MDQEFQDRQGQGAGAVDHGQAGPVPAAAELPRTLSVEILSTSMMGTCAPEANESAGERSGQANDGEAPKQGTETNRPHRRRVGG